MQNWNAGKTQEYKERKEYVVAAAAGTEAVRSASPAGQPAGRSASSVRHETGKRPAARSKKGPSGGNLLLFTTKTCPNCSIARRYLDEADIHYEVILAEENSELAKQYDILQAPTLVVDEGGHVEKVSGAGAIRQYISATA